MKFQNRTACEILIRNITKTFVKVYKKYRKMQILTIVINQIFAYISFVFVYVGV